MSTYQVNVTSENDNSANVTFEKSSNKTGINIDEIYKSIDQ